MKWADSSKGFTIVELLIVVVVIAILAAITIVSYNGIQQQTQNTQTLTAVKEYQKIFISFATEKGRYPTGSTTNNFCLGAGYKDNLCWDERTYTPITSVDAEIRAYVGSIPSPSAVRVYRNSTDLYRAGILYVSSNYTFRYQLQGQSTECGIAGATRSFSANQSTGPECTLQLPDPAAL